MRQGAEIYTNARSPSQSPASCGYYRDVERSRLVESAPVTWVVFDLGEVLATPTALMARLTEAFLDEGLPAAASAVERAYWTHRDLHDRGGSANDFWTAVARDLGHDAPTTLVTRLADVDARAWTDLRPDARSVLRELGARGVRRAILSNAPQVLGATARRRSWSADVDVMLFSGELLVAKPDPAIYAAAQTRLGAAAQDLLFLDDREVNVAAARAAGWRAELWTSPEQMRQVLVDHAVL